MDGKHILLILGITLPLCGLQAQIGQDSVLVNERSMDRPVIVHDRQLRITGGYGFSTFNKRFDQEGEKINLSDEGSTNILHRLSLDLKYGFRDYLQFNLAINYASNNQRQRPINLISGVDTPIELTQINRFNGLEDLFVGVDFLVPWKNKKIDLAFSGGVFLPTASSEPDRPTHTFEDSGDLISIDYTFNENRGLGVLKASLGSTFKYRLENFAFTAAFRYGFPLDESSNRQWSHRLNLNNEFEYRSNEFDWSPSDDYNAFIEVEYQLYPWIDLFLDIEQFGTSGGWSEQSGARLALPEQRLTSISPGVEILLTHKVWIRQKLTLAVEGENAFSPFTVQTTFLYNFFPF